MESHPIRSEHKPHGNSNVQNRQQRFASSFWVGVWRMRTLLRPVKACQEQMLGETPSQLIGFDLQEAVGRVANSGQLGLGFGRRIVAGNFQRTREYRIFGFNYACVQLRDVGFRNCTLVRGRPGVRLCHRLALVWPVSPQLYPPHAWAV
jgi:hypothetical protein